MKKQKKNIKRSLLILSVLTLSSCARIKISNQEWCGDMGELGATCAMTLTSETREIEKVEWDKERFGQVCSKSENFMELKTALQKLCYLTKKCTYQEKKILKELGTKIEYFNKEANDYATSSLTP